MLFFIRKECRYFQRFPSRKRKGANRNKAKFIYENETKLVRGL